MSSRLTIDLETRSAIDLRQTGVYVYAEDPTTAVWCACFAFDDEPVQSWREGEPCPPRIVEHVRNGGAIYAWNAQFERILWNHVLGPKYGWPVPALEQFNCTMAMASVMALPRGLGDAAKALGLDIEKDDAGRRLMLQMCKPRRIEDNGTIIWWEDQTKLQRLIDYCARDVEVEREIFHRLKPLSPDEREVYVLDQKLNDRGVLVDVGSVLAAKVIVGQTLEKLNAELSVITKHAVTAASQVSRMVGWLNQHGVKATKLDKQAVAKLLAEGIEPDDEEMEVDKSSVMDPACRRVLEIRKEAAKSSTAKLEAFESRTGNDGRMRENLLYHGASTGRWAGKGAQLQNLPRPSLKASQQLFALDLFSDQAPDLVDLLIGPPLSVVSDCLRGMIVAPEGHDLIACDFSNIEGRVVAWLAGQDDLTELFRAGGKIYEEMAAFIYEKPVASITKDGIERQLGKTAVLGCGYGMGWAKFLDTCHKANIPVDEALARLAVAKYREKNDRIVSYWYDIEDAAKEAVRNPGKAVKHRHVTYGFDGRYLRCMLPSGRKLWYAAPRLEEDEKHGKLGLTYLGVNSVTKKWGRQRTYGGRLVENITQATARCLLASSMVRLEKAGYKIVLTVHDEIVAEVPKGFGSVEEMEHLMSEIPDWAKTPVVLPVAAEGWRGSRYRK